MPNPRSFLHFLSRLRNRCLGAVEFDGTACIRYYVYAGWSSLVARRAHNPEVVGSNPTPATTPYS